MIHWQDSALILHTQKQQETSTLATAFCFEKGLHKGIIKGKYSLAGKNPIMVGSFCKLTWKARLEEHLGTYTIEEIPLATSAFLIHVPYLLHLMQCTLSLIALLLPEKDPHPFLFESTHRLLVTLTLPLDIKEHFAAYFLWEKLFLAEIGFTLDLSKCAATGDTKDLVYISPKTGRAVSQNAGAPYHSKLLKLPPFFLKSYDQKTLSYHDLINAYDTLGHFLYHPLVSHEEKTQKKLQNIRSPLKNDLNKHFAL